MNIEVSSGQDQKRFFLKVKKYKGAMDSLLDEVFDDLKTSFDKKVSDHFYHIKFTEIRKFFYVLIKKERKNFRWQ